MNHLDIHILGRVGPRLYAIQGSGTSARDFLDKYQLLTLAEEEETMARGNVQVKSLAIHFPGDEFVLSHPDRRAWHAAALQAVANRRHDIKMRETYQNDLWTHARPVARPPSLPSQVLEDLYIGKKTVSDKRKRAILALLEAPPSEEEDKEDDGVSEPPPKRQRTE
jgi:hypothetical protein